MAIQTPFQRDFSFPSPPFLHLKGPPRRNLPALVAPHRTNLLALSASSSLDLTQLGESRKPGTRSAQIYTFCPPETSREFLSTRHTRVCTTRQCSVSSTEVDLPERWRTPWRQASTVPLSEVSSSVFVLYVALRHSEVKPTGHPNSELTHQPSEPRKLHSEPVGEGRLLLPVVAGRRHRDQDPLQLLPAQDKVHLRGRRVQQALKCNKKSVKLFITNSSESPC